MRSLWTTAILLTAGEGSRFHSPLPKQFHRLSGKKVYLYALETFLAIDEIDEVVIVSQKIWHDSIVEDIKNICPKKTIHLIEGGLTRQASSYLGLCACSPQTTHVVIHDAVRPFISEAIIKNNIHLANTLSACDTCIPSHDTLVYSTSGINIDKIPLRSEYLRGQTPQSFAYTLIKHAHEQAIGDNIHDATDDCQLVIRLGHPVQIVQGSDQNIKITTELDLLLAEQILRLQSYRPPSLPLISLTGKTFVVTGGTGGIGQAIIAKLNALGAHTISVSRSAPYPADLTSSSDAKTVFTKIFNEHGSVDGLINALGYLKIGNLKTLTEDEIQQLIHTNFTGFVYACKFCHIKEGGHILNITSTSYTRGRPSYSIYSGMKAAIVNFTQGLALEYPHLQINSLVPPRTKTRMRLENFPQESSADLLDPDKVAEKAVQALFLKEITGMTLEVSLS